MPWVRPADAIWPLLPVSIRTAGRIHRRGYYPAGGCPGPSCVGQGARHGGAPPQTTVGRGTGSGRLLVLSEPNDGVPDRNVRDAVARNGRSKPLPRRLCPSRPEIRGDAHFLHALDKHAQVYPAGGCSPGLEPGRAPRGSEVVSGDIDEAVRSAAFHFLSQQTALHPDGVLPRTLLARGFDYRGTPVPLVGPQGIFKPAVLPELPLSITTVPEKVGHARAYEDELSEDGLLIYRYRGSDPDHRDNVGLRLAMARHVPLIYLAGVLPGQYMPFWPVYTVDDDPRGLCFMVDVSLDAASAGGYSDGGRSIAEPRRRYGTALTLRRLHQQTFRRHVIRAYHDRCAICRLRHTELLDAAHILPDTHPDGKPVVPNGLSLCTLHHAAFDRNIIGVRPDLIVDVREDIRKEADGPMLRHGLQGFHGTRLHVPRAELLRPNSAFLEERYEWFRRAA